MAMRKKEKGFTLVEMLIAVSMLMVALVGMVSVTVMVLKGNSFSRHMTTATTLANDKLEDLKHKAFISGDLTNGDHHDALNPIDSLYTRSWSVTSTLDATNTKVVMKQVVVMVRWPWGGQTRTVEMKTIIANPNY